jgi:hypothetical protein
VEQKQEYKDITLDMSVKEIMELDLDRVEYFVASVKGWQKTTNNHFEIIKTMEDASAKYRYNLNPKESIRITKELVTYLYEYGRSDDLEECNCLPKWDNKKLISINGHKVEIIGGEK